jgi:uncharacterized protein (TIGR04255 family)
MTAYPHPFSGPPPEEVPLPRAPLIRVLSQITFPPILAIEKTENVASFQEKIRAAYPNFQGEVMHEIQIDPNNQPNISKTHIWRFEDKNRRWQASLAPNFLALTTAHYTSRSEFLSRMGELIAALQDTIDPQIMQRVGLRYIDRLQGEPLQHLARFIRPEFLGPNTADYQHAAIHILTQALFNTEENAKLSLRWGRVPPHATVDPQAVQPINEPSWVMDFDMFNDSEGSFQHTDLAPLLEKFAQRIYSVFRYMVTDDFLKYYGGQP